MRVTYFYMGWSVTIGDLCTEISNHTEHIRVEFPTEQEALEWIDEYEGGNKR